MMLLIAIYFNPAIPFLEIDLTEVKNLCTMMFIVLLLRWLKFGNHLNIYIHIYISQQGNN